jgi:1,4-alpha-glucan branching enzyme
MYKLLELNPKLMPYKCNIDDRMIRLEETKKRLLPDGGTLKDFANAHHYFGFHHVEGGWYYREWAPNAEQLYLTGDFNRWNKTSHPLKPLANGSWEIFLEGDTALWEGCKVKVVVDTTLGRNERIPLFARYVTQNPKTLVWCAEVQDDQKVFKWTDKRFKPSEKIFIYEAHVGMAQEEGKVGSYKEFADKILPRIKEAGYNTIQLMAVMEHPYYASFGYQVSNFYAVSSWFGKPNDLKKLINKAHRLGIRVLLDIVHSHAVKNHAEGINMFDGTAYQFFHEGMRGEHPAWGTKCFDYSNPGVLHFLLSNLKYWMQEYHFDGFRFDGITSMLYLNHGLGVYFSNEAMYFTDNTDIDAIVYLQLANELIKQINPKAITIAEDMSGMPGMCLPIKEGGIGFDYRLNMGIPDMWIHTASKEDSNDWMVEKIWREICLRRKGDRTVAYVESHDQALVGDQTMIFRLANDSMYTDMDRSVHTPVIDRAVGVHKLARLLTIAAGGEAYLNFMGNEFGHPEWIDFPREGNDWSYQYCRRQWSLQDNPFLKYKGLGAFDRDMLKLIGDSDIFDEFFPQLMLMNEEKKSFVFSRNGYVFAFNFHPDEDYDAHIPMLEKAEYQLLLSSDDEKYEGMNRVTNPTEETENMVGEDFWDLTIPSLTALVFKQIEKD